MKKRKQLLSIMLCLVLCCTMSFSFSGKLVKAATRNTTDSWIDPGNYTKSWMNTRTQTDIYGNEGTEKQPYVIKNEKDFAALSYYSFSYGMTFEGKYIEIEPKEIDLAQHYWYPIGEVTQFKGTIVGNGHTIKNVFIGNKSEYSTEQYVGLFGYSAGSIYGLHVQNAEYYVNSSYVGGLVGHWENGIVKNCTVQGIINNQHTNSTIGGVIGYGSSEVEEIDDCFAQVTISSYVDAGSERNKIGGLLGLINSSKLNILNCAAYGEIMTGNNHTVGGLVGLNQASAVTEYCETNVAIHSGMTSYAGGIFGYIYNASSCITKCDALGDIFANTSSNVGGFIGFSNSSKVTYQDCYAKGNVFAKGSANVGGFAGSLSGDTVKQCGALGNIVAEDRSFTGGFVGRISQTTITNSYSLGDVKAELSSYVGGFGGYNSAAASIINCFTKGGVQGGTGSTVGGFIALKSSNLTLKRCYWNKSAEQKLDKVSRKENQKIAVGNIPSLKLETTKEEFMRTKEFAEYLNEFVEQSEEEFDYWIINPNLNNGYPFTVTLQDLLFDNSGGYEELTITEKEGSKDKEMGVYGVFYYPEIPVSEKPDEPEDYPIHISLQWGSLEYEYKSGGYDEATNTYADGTWSPKEAGVSDLIRVVNKSETDIKANFTYVASDADEGNYLNINGQFEDYEAGEAVTGNVIVGAKDNDLELSKVIRFSLNGAPERRVNHTFSEQIGKIVLTVSKNEVPEEKPETSGTSEPSYDPATAEPTNVAPSPEPSYAPATVEPTYAAPSPEPSYASATVEPTYVEPIPQPS